MARPSQPPILAEMKSVANYVKFKYVHFSTSIRPFRFDSKEIDTIIIYRAPEIILVIILAFRLFGVFATFSERRNKYLPMLRNY